MRWPLMLVIGGGTLLVSLPIFLLLSASTTLSPDEVTGAVCNSYHYTGEQATNLLFFADESTVKRYTDYLFSKQPFEKHKEQFNVYYIDNVNVKKSCDLYRGIALLCYSAELIETAAACPHNLIIVTDSRPENIRSSSYKEVLSINTNHPNSVLLHEAGHGFVNLAEEYIIPASPSKGSQNCAEECSDFGQDGACFEGCSDNNHKRSIENGVMRTLDSEVYGSFDEHLLDEYLSRPALYTASSAYVINEETECNEKEYYLFTVVSSSNGLEVLNRERKKGCPTGTIGTTFHYQYDVPGDSLSEETFFNGDLIFNDAPQGEGIEGSPFENTAPFYVSTPIPQGAQEINFFENNVPIGTASLFDAGGRTCAL